MEKESFDQHHMQHVLLAQAFMGEVYASFLFISFLSGVVLDKRCELL